MQPTILGIDVSFWQDNNATPQKVDWQKAKTAGTKFAFIRAGQGGRSDQDFDYNWSESKKAGIPRGAYWYLDYRTDSAAQAARFRQKVASTGDSGELPLAIDFEMRTDAPGPLMARGRLRTALATVEKLDGRVPILYTSPAYWHEFGNADVSWKRYPLWLAHYLTAIPMVPSPWPTWTFWQFTDKGDGLAFGMESRGLDLNYYHPGLGFDDVILGERRPEPVEGELSDAEKLARLWAAHPELHL